MTAIHFPTVSPTLRTVCNELGEVEYKAFKIGIQLGISRSKMLLFKQKDDILSEVVDFWLRGNVPDVPITWGSVVKALKSKQVGEPGLAKVISEKYCCQQREEDEKGKQCSHYIPIAVVFCIVSSQLLRLVRSYLLH